MRKKDEICLIFIGYCFILLLFLRDMHRILYYYFLGTCIEYFIFVLNQVYFKNIFVKFLETLKEFYLSRTINTPLLWSAFISSIRDLSNGSQVNQNCSIGKMNSNIVAFLSLLMHSRSLHVMPIQDLLHINKYSVFTYAIPLTLKILVSASRADTDSTEPSLVCRADTDPFQTPFGTPLIFSSSELGKNLI